MKSNENLVSIAFMMGYWGTTVDEFFKRIKRQETSFPVEIVAAYYGSDEESYKKLEANADKTIRIPKSEYNCGSTRDLACSIASGRYIVTMSVDSLPLNDHWLENIAKPMIESGADIVQGAIQCPEEGDSNYPDFFYWENNYGFYFTSEAKKFYKKYGNFGKWGYWGFAAPNLAFTKEIWKKTGFSGARYNGDNVFQKKVGKYKPKIVYKEDAIVLHAHSYKTILSLFNRSSNEGLGWRDIGEKYSFFDMIHDISRMDLHLKTLKLLLAGKLKYSSEIFFHFIRPISLYWGNNFAKNLYSDKRK